MSRTTTVRLHDLNEGDVFLLGWDLNRFIVISADEFADEAPDLDLIHEWVPCRCIISGKVDRMKGTLLVHPQKDDDDDD